MATGTQSPPERNRGTEDPQRPEITVCESCPGTSVFFESGNTDGWIASDLTIEVDR
jgi:hypothetical protein